MAVGQGLEHIGRLHDELSEESYAHEETRRKLKAAEDTVCHPVGGPRSVACYVR
jgi:hypothetical protein